MFLNDEKHPFTVNRQAVDFSEYVDVPIETEILSTAS